MSPTRRRLLDLAEEFSQLTCGMVGTTTPTNLPLSHGGSLSALRSIRGVHTAISHGCKFGCRCVGTEHLVAVGWQFVTTLPQLATRTQRRCAGGHVHVQRALGQQVPTACEDPLWRAYAKPETAWKLLSLWQQSTTCQVKRDHVTFLVVRILRDRVSDVCT